MSVYRGLVGFGLWLLCGCGVFAAEGLAADAMPELHRALPSALFVESRNGRLSIEAHNVALAEALERIAKESGLAISWHVPLDETISTRFRGLPVETGIRRLLSGYNFVLVYEEVPGGSRHDHARANLSGVEVFANGFAHGAEPGRTRPIRHRAARGNFTQRLMDASSSGLSGENEGQMRGIGARALYSSDAAAREDAVGDLFFADDEAYAAEILSEVLEQDPDPDVRTSALEALEGLDPVPVTPVLDASVYDAAPEVRLRALEVIEFEEWRDDATIETLAIALEDASQEVRLTAVEILVDLEQRHLLEFASRANPDIAVRELALDFLSES